MPVPVLIPISRFDYRAEYKRPVISIWLDRAALVQTLFDVLEQWNLKIDDVEPVTTGTPSEQGLKLKLPAKKMAMFLGAGHCTFTKEDSDWSSAEEIITVLRTFLNVLRETGKVEIGKQETKVALHIQPTSGTFVDLLKPFVSPEVQRISGGELTTGATVVKWSSGRIVLDGSGALANAMFLQFEQHFPGTEEFEEMAHQIQKMEEKLFQLLNIEEAK